MASSVATPLERQFSRIAGVNQMTSNSAQGSANIALQFDLNRDINGAARDVQAAISAARAQLPANLPMNPTYRKINPSDAPILILALTSDTMPVPQLYDAADSILAQKIAAVQGVGQTNVGGSAKPAVRLEVNPNQLTAYQPVSDAACRRGADHQRQQAQRLPERCRPRWQALGDQHHRPAVWCGCLPSVGDCNQSRLHYECPGQQRLAGQCRQCCRFKYCGHGQRRQREYRFQHRLYLGAVKHPTPPTLRPQARTPLESYAWATSRKSSMPMRTRTTLAQRTASLRS